MRKSIPSIHSQLLANQLWETVAFMAKAAFLFVLTPIMIGKWGVDGYGEFAIASSTMIFVSIFDLGLRGRVRVELCHAIASDEQEKKGRILACAVSHFLIIASLVLILIFILSSLGMWSRLMNLPPGQDHVIVITAIGTQLLMLSGFFTENLIAEGRIGVIKLASALGGIMAIPSVWLTLHLNGGVAWAMGVWLGCLTTANLVVLIVTGHWFPIFHWPWRTALHGTSLESLSAGFWFNITNIAWLGKNHGLTFLISAISGPAVAGVFFIILRLCEIVGSFGSISSDVIIGGMATKNIDQRRQVFTSAYRYATILSLLLALGIGFLTPAFWMFWLKTPAPLGWATGWLAAMLGLSSGLNRIVIYASMALGIVRQAGVWSLIETAVTLLGGCFLQESHGLMATLGLAIFSVTALLPVALNISRQLELCFWKTWLPLKPPYYEPNS